MPIDTIPPSIDLSGFVDRICISYTRRHLFRGGPVDIAVRVVETYGVSLGYHQKGDGEDLLHKAILSLSIVFFGTLEKQPALMRKGRQIYSTTIERLNMALDDSEKRRSDFTLLAILTLGLLEVELPVNIGTFANSH